MLTRRLKFKNYIKSIKLYLKRVGWKFCSSIFFSFSSTLVKLNSYPVDVNAKNDELKIVCQNVCSSKTVAKM